MSYFPGDTTNLKSGHSDLLDLIPEFSITVTQIQTQDTYWKCILNKLHTPTVDGNFTLQNILQKHIQNSNKIFDVLVILKLIALTILANGHNFQGHASTTETYPSLKETSFTRL